MNSKKIKKIKIKFVINGLRLWWCRIYKVMHIVWNGNKKKKNDKEKENKKDCNFYINRNKIKKWCQYDFKKIYFDLEEKIKYNLICQ